MPAAQSELHYDNTFQLLVAVMLSAQCTDKRVNMVTPALFSAYPDARSLAEASVEDILGYIKSVSYPNSKSRHLKGMAEKLVADFGGEVPDDVEKLQTLPGVGRKTANVICAVIFNQSVMPVDTHVFRVSERIGLTTNSKSPLQTELTLEKNIPAEKIPVAHHWLILHGRYVCTARSPHCGECGISGICRHRSRMQGKKKTTCND
jgi:endonuclease-3